MFFGSFSSLSPGSSTECRSPSPFSLAPPKKRFKIDALKDEISNQDRSETIKAEPFLGPRDNDNGARGQKSPFRPWMSDENNSKQEEIIKTEPQPIIPAGIYHPYLLLLQHPKALELAGTYIFSNKLKLRWFPLMRLSLTQSSTYALSNDVVYKQ